MYTTIRNIVLALCIGSIVAITINMKAGADSKAPASNLTASIQEYSGVGMSSSPASQGFNRTALALGFFVFSALFIVKPIRERA